MDGTNFVIVAYALTWLVLGGYAAYVWRRFRRAERELRAQEAVAGGAMTAPSARSERVGGGV